MKKRNICQNTLLYTFLTFVLSLIVYDSVYAYVPQFDMILSRVSRNHGHGIHFIEQEVVFPNEPEPLILTEHWTFENENKVKLRVYGQGELKDHLQITFVYDENKKYFLDKDGVKKVSTKFSEWIHPYLFFRDIEKIKTKLFAQKIIPASFLDSNLKNATASSNQIETQKFLKLARSGGSISYFTGEPSTPQNLKPGLWIIQDQFHINKLRLESLAELTAQDYGCYTRKLCLPKTQIIHWGDHFIRVNLRKVRGLTGNSSLKKKLLHSSLDKSDPSNITFIPEINLIKEFYVRFR